MLIDWDQLGSLLDLFDFLNALMVPVGYFLAAGLAGRCNTLPQKQEGALEDRWHISDTGKAIV